MTDALVDVFKAQLVMQAAQTDADFAALKRKRDSAIRKLTTRERLQLKLAGGTLFTNTDRA